MKFSVIGAGSGGRAFCAYISSKGFDVTLYNRSRQRIKEIEKKRGVNAKGELTGFFKIQKTTQDIKNAIRGADIILVVTPASAHRDIAKLIAPHLCSNQIILLNPGRTFGAVEFKREIENKIGKIPLLIAETQTLLFTAREFEGNGVHIIKIKNSVDFSAYPEKITSDIYGKIKDVFPQLNPVENYLETTLYNIGMLLHPTISLLNAGTIDIGKPIKFYTEGASYHVSKVLEKIESEIQQIFNIFGLKDYNFVKWVEKSYGTSENTIFDSIQNIEPYKEILAPKELITRYFSEDVPMGLVPISSLGKFLGINTPTIDSIIHLSSVLCEIDFNLHGRTIEKLKLEKYLRKKVNTLQIIDLMQ